MPSLDPTFRKLDGSVTDHFDCGENDQNKFLRESAWPDQKQGWSVTYLAYVKGMLAGYVALSNDALELTKRERPTDAPYGRIGAVKIVQLGVDRRFQRHGLGEMLLDFAISLCQASVRGIRLPIRHARFCPKPSGLLHQARFQD